MPTASRKSRCRYTTRRGRCRIPATRGHALCTAHAKQAERDLQFNSAEVAEILGEMQEFTSVDEVNYALGQLFSLAARKQIRTRDAAILSYMCQLLLQTLKPEPRPSYWRPPVANYRTAAEERQRQQQEQAKREEVKQKAVRQPTQQAVHQTTQQGAVPHTQTHTPPQPAATNRAATPTAPAQTQPQTPARTPPPPAYTSQPPAYASQPWYKAPPAAAAQSAPQPPAQPPPTQAPPTEPPPPQEPADQTVIPRNTAEYQGPRRQEPGKINDLADWRTYRGILR
ncbi:MAG TPA: hypothetical protein VN862_04115 [Candidatus Acidoferrales bacterium]|nr:hypothetical protein [Candidatus Acidoferrales bacterium]